MSEHSYIDKLRKELKEECSAVKDCFTKFSFQVLALNSVVLGLIINFQSDYPPAALAAIPLILLSLAVSRIGNYKYGTFNRNSGYLLHLERTNPKPFMDHPPAPSAWRDYMREIGWEEAMRAWRIVQPTIFDGLYNVSKYRPNTFKVQHNQKSWFIPSRLIIDGSSYYPGGYLKSMHWLLYCLSWGAIVPLIVMLFQLLFVDFGYTNHIRLVLTISDISLIIITIMAVIIRYRKDTRRREILEGEFLSIHSCGILWQAVVIAHYRALYLTLSQRGNYSGYTYCLSSQAISLRNNISNIHGWIIDPDSPAIVQESPCA